MKIAYVSDVTLKECIEYFSEITITSPEQLGIFFFFKSIGFNEIEYKSFPKISGISEEFRKEYMSNMYNLSSLFNKSEESGGKRCCLFPFAIEKQKYFNPSTTFDKIIGRIRDTMDNTLIDKFLKKDDSNPDNFKFPRNYIQLLKDDFLKNHRISLVYFAAWYFRFRGVECDDSWFNDVTKKSNKAFTRVCIKILSEELNLTELELNELFYHNEDEVIIFSKDKISGQNLRQKIKFDKDSIPEIEILPSGGIDYMNETEDISIQKTEKLSQPTGDNISVESLMKLLIASKQVILYGIPGTSKSHITNEIKKHFTEFAMVQFHASITYEQFIGGISIDSNGEFISKSGVFLGFCERARKNENSQEKYLFIIDEINRSNVSKVFGETILTLDREYVVDLVNPIEFENNKISKFSIPSNVYIIATMNSSDRSIAQIDYAIRRRFAFVKFYPNYELIQDMSDCSLLANNIKPDVLLKSINKEIFNVLKDENMLLGHAFFIPKWAIGVDNKINWTPEVLRMLINYYIIPIIEEYTYGNSRYLANILGDVIPKRIEDDSLLMDELIKQFKVD